MKKWLKRILILLLVVLLSIPIPAVASDGGSKIWAAVLWQVEKPHEDTAEGYRVGLRISLFMGLITIYDHTEIVPYESE